MDEGGGWFRLSLVRDTTTTASDAFRLFVCDADNSIAVTGDGTSGIFIWGAQLEESATATAYQKVVSQYDVTETGVPSVHYLRFDGVDDAMATPSIDFTGTDEMSVFAGVRKLTTTAQVITELSFNTGTFYHVVGDSAPKAYSAVARGSASLTSPLIGFEVTDAPDTAVFTALHDISGDLSRVRRNGVVGTDGTADKGTGNFSNNIMYIGARSQNSLYFNGHLYGLTVRGALTDAATLAKTEKLVAKKTGISL